MHQKKSSDLSPLLFYIFPPKHHIIFAHPFDSWVFGFGSQRCARQGSRQCNDAGGSKRPPRWPLCEWNRLRKAIQGWRTCSFSPSNHDFVCYTACELSATETCRLHITPRGIPTLPRMTIHGNHDSQDRDMSLVQKLFCFFSGGPCNYGFKHPNRKGNLGTAGQQGYAMAISLLYMDRCTTVPSTGSPWDVFPNQPELFYET